METKDSPPGMVGTNTKSERSVWKKTLETLKLSAWGDKAEKLRMIWGTAPFIGLITGFVIAIALARFGALPMAIVADKYESPLQVTQAGQKPSKIEVRSMQPIPDWLQPYAYWLESEGDALKNHQSIKGYQVCSLVSDQLSAAPKFIWTLKASPGFRLSGWGFRVTKDGLLEPLLLSNIESTTRSFAVPGSMEGDKLIAVVSIIGEQAAPSGECQDYIRSSVN